MKKKKVFIAISTILLIIGLFITEPFCNYSVDKKVTNEYDTIYRKIYPLHAQSYIGIEYSKYTVEFYKEENVPERPSDNIAKFGSSEFVFAANKEEVDYWDRYYSGMAHRYPIKWQNYYHKEYATNGWCINTITFNQIFPTNFYICQYFPFEYVESDLSPWARNYISTPKDLIKESLDWFLKNPESLCHNGIYENDAYENILAIIESIPNRYHSYVVDTIAAVSFTKGIGLDGKSYGSSFGSVGNQPLVDNYYGNETQKVFIAISSPTTYSLKRNEVLIASEKKTNKIVFIIILLIIYILLVYSPIKSFILYRQDEQLKIKDKLLKLCNPQQYINIDREKFSISNNLYSRIINIPECNVEELLDISEELEAKLNISLINKDKLALLIEKANPKHFMRPYNAERVERANELYHELIGCNISYKRFVYIQKEIEDLYSFRRKATAPYFVGQIVINLNNEEILRIKEINKDDGILSCVNAKTNEFVGNFDEFEIADYDSYFARKRL